MVGLILCLLTGGAFAQAPPSSKPDPITAADLERGGRLFQGHCAFCHGPKGDGGKGANLARPRLVRAPDEKALFDVIRHGISGTEMPGAWQMTEREIWLVAAHVQTLGKNADERVPGDLGRGKNAFWNRNKCGACHMVNGEGGRSGPELTDIGSRRSPAHLKQSLVEPSADMPEGFARVRVELTDGRKVEGLRLNEDTFSVQLLDSAERTHSFWKYELKSLETDRSRSPMPAYGKQLTPAEIDDLVAYLYSLRGAQ